MNFSIFLSTLFIIISITFTKAGDSNPPINVNGKNETDIPAIDNITDGGRTAYSIPKLPLDVHCKPNAMCNIKKRSRMVALMQTNSVIIWDECTMTHKHSLDALHRRMQDLNGKDKLFGASVLPLSDDFRHALPVVPLCTATFNRTTTNNHNKQYNHNPKDNNPNYHNYSKNNYHNHNYNKTRYHNPNYTKTDYPNHKYYNHKYYNHNYYHCRSECYNYSESYSESYCKA
ncbi:unnamed protein product [Diabrotica balteata]|uniref:ATP-dependent DNA helicase n=1 Tax=Diabrotica balteata TaxID=107213 RepID=A0A9N9SUU6_DIABA|nr:unnamed protein product [Diabrotica balteata]